MVDNENCSNGVAVYLYDASVTPNCVRTLDPSAHSFVPGTL